MIRIHAIDFYQKFFENDGVSNLDPKVIQQNIPKHLDFYSFKRGYKKITMFDLDSASALGPDGFSSAFLLLLLGYNRSSAILLSHGAYSLRVEL